MDELKNTNVSDVRKYFLVELLTVMRRQQVSAVQESVEYVVDLMIRYMQTEAFYTKDGNGKLGDNVLADIYAEYINGDIQRKKIMLQRLGDISLLVTGFFSDSLNKKIVDLDYYFGMGGTAYHQLAELHLKSQILQTVYLELAQKFKIFAEALGEISEKGGIQSNKDILRLYEKYLSTGSERAKELLSKHGIDVPFKVDSKVRH